MKHRSSPLPSFQRGAKKRWGTPNSLWLLIWKTNRVRIFEPHSHVRTLTQLIDDDLWGTHLRTIIESLHGLATRRGPSELDSKGGDIKVLHDGFPEMIKNLGKNGIREPLKDVLLEPKSDLFSRSHVDPHVVRATLEPHRFQKHPSPYGFCHTLYLLAATHWHGQFSFYPGTTTDIGARMSRHRQYVRDRDAGAQKHRQSIHDVHAAPGWTTSYHILGNFHSALQVAAMLLVEIIMMSIFRSISTTAV